MNIAAAILAIVSAFLPLLLKWLSKRMEPPNELDVLKQVHSKELHDLAEAVGSGTAIDVASVWARHDRLLLESGLSRPGAGSDRSRRVGDSREPRRDVHGDRGLDAPAARVRTSPPHRFRTVRTATGLEIPVFD